MNTWLLLCCTMAVLLVAAGTPALAADPGGRKGGPPRVAAAAEPVAAPATAPADAPATEVRVQVLNKPLGAIDRRLFGQFMERPSWGETGPEGALAPGTGQLLPAVVKLLEEMKIPIVRFPGGTDVDYLDWRDMVDNVPGREGGRPVSTGHKGDQVTNRFGYDEFLRLAERLGWDTIIVVNLADGLLGRRPIKEAALHAAGLVAYCNAAVGAKLPAGLPDWPAVRAKNGREKPYGVKYIQLGNEIWAFADRMKEKHGDRRDDVHAECLREYERAIHAVDPSVTLIMDNNEAVTAKVPDLAGKKIPLLAGHFYGPWGIKKVVRDGAEVPLEKLTAEEIWYAWVASPKIDAQGQSMLEANVWKAAPAVGCQVAVTEWNWNGGWGHGPVRPALDSELAKGLGAAGFLHGLMRRADRAVIGTQSMLVGTGWGIAAVAVDRKGEQPPRIRASGMVTMLYSQHHGDRLLETSSSGVPFYNQPFEMGGIKPNARVAMIDALATASERAVYWHAINRSFDQALEVTLDVSAMGPVAEQGRQFVLEGKLEDVAKPGEPQQLAAIRQANVPVSAGRARVTLPPRSVSVVEVERK